MKMVDFEWDIINRRKKLLEADINIKKAEIEKIDKNIKETKLSTNLSKEKMLSDLNDEKSVKQKEVEIMNASLEVVLIEIESMETKKKHENEMSKLTIESFEDHPRIRKLSQKPEEYMGLEQIDIELYPLIDSDSIKKYYDEGMLLGKLNVVKRKHYYYFKHKNLLSIIKYHCFGIKPKKQISSGDCKTEKLTIELPIKYIENLHCIAKDLNMTLENIFCEAIILYKEKIQYNLITEKERLLDKVKKIDERIYSMYETTDSK